MVNYPIEFNSRSVMEKESEKWKLKTGEGLEIEMSVPEEFGGDSQHSSPEDLFSASIQSCLIASFAAIADRKNLKYRSLECTGSIDLDRGENSRPLMKNGKLKLEIRGLQDEQKADKVAEAAIRNCFIHNSVKSDIEIEIIKSD